MEKYKVCEQHTGPVEIEAENMTAAIKIVRDWLAEYAEPEDITTWASATVERSDGTGDEESITIRTDPTEPTCNDGEDHDWSIGESYGHGGGVITTDTCRICGVQRQEDTWAMDADTGEHGLTTIEYFQPTGENLPSQPSRSYEGNNLKIVLE